MGLITVDVKDRKLIYEQLIDNIRALILSGLLAPEEFLPSVRTLSRELGINPNTIQKAYAELERQGIIVSFQGRGSMVTSDVEVVRRMAREWLVSEVRKTAEEAKRVNMTLADFTDIAKEAWEGEEHHD